MAASARSRPAAAEDVDALCGDLPGTWFGTSWGDVPTWLVTHRVRDGVDKGRGFLLYRQPHKSAVDPATGEPYDDLLVIRTADDADKQALVEGDGPFFTIDHFNGYNAVLVRVSRLSEITYAELGEVITDAWCACAPKRMVAAFLAAQNEKENGGQG